MATIGRLKEGDLQLAGEMNERLPAITNGLVSYFPFDGAGGAWDIVGGNQSVQNVEQGVNLVESMASNWRKPESWSSTSGVSWDEEKQALKMVGYKNMWLKTPIIIDPNKRYELMYEVLIEERSTNGTSEGYLYLGGLSNNKDGVRATRNYDYTIASAERPPIGEWTTFKMTRTGTAVAGNGDSYTYDNVKGWTGDADQSTGIDRLVKYYHMGGLFNYSSGGVMYLRNMRMAVVSEDTSNTTLLDEGIAVEESTNNLCVNDGQTGDSPFGGDGSPSLNVIDDLIRFRGNKVARFRTGTSGNFYINGSSKITQTASTGFASSLYIKRADGQPITSIGTYLYVGGNSNDNGPATYLEEVEDGWYRAIRIRSGLVNGTVSLFGCNGLGANTEYLIANWQLEDKAYATSYTLNSRASGKLYLSDIGGYTDYTICGQAKLDHPFRNNGGYVETPRNGAYLFSIYDRTISGHIGFRYWENSSGTSGPYLSRSGTYGSGNMHKYYELNAHEWTFFVIQKSGTRFSFRFHQNGWRDEHVATVDATARLDDLWFGNSTMLNVLYKNISVYDRALNEEEIQKNCLRTFSVSKEGNLSSNIKEESLQADNGTHFPFGSDTSSRGGGVQALTSTNEAYRNGALWIGESTTNYGTKEYLSAYVGYSTFEWEGNTIRRETTNDNGYLVMRASPLYPEQGKTISVSGYMYVNGVPGDYKASSGSKITTYSGYTTTYMHSNPQTGYFEATVVVAADATSGWLFHSATPAKTIGDILTIENLQIEEHTVPTPYTASSRGNSDIVLPYNTVDCKTDFTISGWFYPKVFADGKYRPFLTRNRITSNVTYQRILIMGSNTSSRRLRCWYGSAGSETSVYAPSNIEVKDNEWNFFCLRRSGNTMSLFLGVGGQIGYGTSTSGAYLNADEDPNTWGWLIGNYSNSLAQGYARDYVFHQKSLADSEIEEIYKTQMRSHKSGTLQIQGQIKEGGLS